MKHLCTFPHLQTSHSNRPKANSKRNCILNVLSWVCSEKEACPLGSCGPCSPSQVRSDTCNTDSLNDWRITRVEGLLELFEWCHSAAVPLAIWLSYCKCAKNVGPSLNFYLCWGQPCGLPHYTEPAGATLLGRQPALSSQQEQFQLNLQSKREGSGWSIKTNSARISAKWWSVTVCPSSWENKTLFRDCIPLLSVKASTLVLLFKKKQNKIQTIRRLII